MLDPPVEHTADRNSVGEHQRHDLEGDNRVERHRRTDVDQRQQTCDDASQSDRIRGDMHRGMHMGDPAVEGEAFIASKGPCLAAGRCVIVDVCGDDEDEDHDCEDVDAAGW